MNPDQIKQAWLSKPYFLKWESMFYYTIGKTSDFPEGWTDLKSDRTFTLARGCGEVPLFRVVSSAYQQSIPQAFLLECLESDHLLCRTQTRYDLKKSSDSALAGLTSLFETLGDLSPEEDDDGNIGDVPGYIILCTKPIIDHLMDLMSSHYFSRLCHADQNGVSDGISGFNQFYGEFWEDMEKNFCNRSPCGYGDQKYDRVQLIFANEISHIRYMPVGTDGGFTKIFDMPDGSTIWRKNITDVNRYFEQSVDFFDALEKLLGIPNLTISEADNTVYLIKWASSNPGLSPLLGRGTRMGAWGMLWSHDSAPLLVSGINTKALFNTSTHIPALDHFVTNHRQLITFTRPDSPNSLKGDNRRMLEILAGPINTGKFKEMMDLAQANPAQVFLTVCVQMDDRMSKKAAEFSVWEKINLSLVNPPCSF